MLILILTPTSVYYFYLFHGEEKMALIVVCVAKSVLLFTQRVFCMVSPNIINIIRQYWIFNIYSPLGNRPLLLAFRGIVGTNTTK